MPPLLSWMYPAPLNWLVTVMTPSIVTYWPNSKFTPFASFVFTWLMGRGDPWTYTRGFEESVVFDPGDIPVCTVNVVYSVESGELMLLMVTVALSVALSERLVISMVSPETAYEGVPALAVAETSPVVSDNVHNDGTITLAFVIVPPEPP